MNKNRLEAFSDAVIAIIITIMILELKVPKIDSFESLRPLVSSFLSYVLSFCYLAIYWNNHHHMLQVTKKVNGTVLWANTFLLFWLSLIPFATSWIGTQDFSAVPMSLYGFILLMCAISYFTLQNKIISLEGDDSLLHRAVKSDMKGKISIVGYLLAIPLAFVSSWISGFLYIAIALLWVVPDKRIEKQVEKSN